MVDHGPTSTLTVVVGPYRHQMDLGCLGEVPPVEKYTERFVAGVRDETGEGAGGVHVLRVGLGDAEPGR